MKKRIRSFIERFKCVLAILYGNNYIFVKMKKTGATIHSFGISQEAAIEYLTKVSVYGNRFQQGKRYSIYELTKAYHSTVVEDGGTELKEPLFFASKNRLIMPHRQFLIFKNQKRKATKLFKAVYNR
jgi:hypothetical protein